MKIPDLFDSEARKLAESAEALRARWENPCLELEHWLIALLDNYQQLIRPRSDVLFLADLNNDRHELMRSRQKRMPKNPLSIEEAKNLALPRMRKKTLSLIDLQTLAEMLLSAADAPTSPEKRASIEKSSQPKTSPSSSASSTSKPFTISPGDERSYDTKSLEFMRTNGRDLTAAARKGEFAPFVGREEEIQLVIETLCRRTKRNPVLVGPAGVGKTAIVEGLAKRIAEGDVPGGLSDCRIFSVQTTSLISGAWWYGTIEYRINQLLAEAREPRVIVFIDEIHTIIRSGPTANTSRDIAQQIKPALARGELVCIGATTEDEYRRYIESDEALERRFQPIRVEELSSEQTLPILQTLRDEINITRDIVIEDSALGTILDFAERFLRNRHFPDKAIDLLEQTIANAASLDKTRVTPAEVEVVFNRMVGVPGDLNDSLESLKKAINKKELLNKEQADNFCNLLSVSMQGVSLNPAEPNAILLLPGEAAKKATRLAETTAETLFGSKQRVIKIDFGTLNESYLLSKLIGASPGIDDFGAVTALQRIAQTPWCVLLCENLEAAHPIIRDIWARALEDGFITDGKGKRVFLSDTIVILTAGVPGNLMRKFGFSPQETDENEWRERLEKVLDKNLVRAADLVVFDEEGVTETAHREWLKENLFHNLTGRFRRQNVFLHWDESLIRELVRRQGESEEPREWEKLINLWLIPKLLPHLAGESRARSLKVKFTKGEIVVEASDPIAENAEPFSFTSPAQRKFFEQIIIWLRDFPAIQYDRDSPIVNIRENEINALITVSDWNNQVLITIQARVAGEIEPDADLWLFLLRKNLAQRFGKFGVEVDGSVWLEYSFPGVCDRETFSGVLKNILEAARKYQMGINGNWGTEKAELGAEAAAWLEAHRIK